MFHSETVYIAFRIEIDVVSSVKTAIYGGYDILRRWDLRWLMNSALESDNGKRVLLCWREISYLIINCYRA